MKKLLTLFAVSVAVIVGAMGYISLVDSAEAATCRGASTGSEVIKCGVWSVNEMRDAYNSDRTPGTKNIFSGMGITSDMVNKSTVKEGAVGKDGRVIVDGKVVATNAWSSGRTVMSHTTQRVKRTYNGTVYYESPTSDSFRSSTLASYVFFDSNGRFQGAVILDCGNPVRATPTQPKPEPKDITVCRLEDKKYPVTIKENEFDSKKHSKDPEDCKEKPAPVAICQALDALVITNRTNVALKATAKVEHGATISSYFFTVTDKDGKVVQTKTVNSSQSTASTSMNIAEAGSYKAKVVVKTSLGYKTAVECEKQFVIAAPEPKDITVCHLKDKKYPVTIKENEFDSSKHSYDEDDCKDEQPVTPEVPVELPRTGVTDGIISALGLGALTTASFAYVVSRRQIL